MLHCITGCVSPDAVDGVPTREGHPDVSRTSPSAIDEITATRLPQSDPIFTVVPRRRVRLG